MKTTVTIEPDQVRIRCDFLEDGSCWNGVGATWSNAKLDVLSKISNGMQRLYTSIEDMKQEHAAVARITEPEI